jgi:hypothetical protein
MSVHSSVCHLTLARRRHCRRSILSSTSSRCASPPPAAAASIERWLDGTGPPPRPTAEKQMVRPVFQSPLRLGPPAPAGLSVSRYTWPMRIGIYPMVHIAEAPVDRTSSRRNAAQRCSDPLVLLAPAQVAVYWGALPFRLFSVCEGSCLVLFPGSALSIRLSACPCGDHFLPGLADGACCWRLSRREVPGPFHGCLSVRPGLSCRRAAGAAVQLHAHPNVCLSVRPAGHLHFSPFHTVGMLCVFGVHPSVDPGVCLHSRSPSVCPSGHPQQECVHSPPPSRLQVRRPPDGQTRRASGMFRRRWWRKPTRSRPAAAPAPHRAARRRGPSRSSGATSTSGTCSRYLAAPAAQVRARDLWFRVWVWCATRGRSSAAPAAQVRRVFELRVS